MDRRRIARRLGGTSIRRRRHRRVAATVVVLLAVAGGLILLGGDDDDGAPQTVASVCLASNEEIGTAQRALLTDNQTPEAIAGFLGDAFVDLTRDRAAAIRELRPGDEVLAILDEHDAIVDAIEADPVAAAGSTNPFDAVNDRWRDVELDECVIDASTVPS